MFGVVVVFVHPWNQLPCTVTLWREVIMTRSSRAVRNRLQLHKLRY